MPRARTGYAAFVSLYAKVDEIKRRQISMWLIGNACGRCQLAPPMQEATLSEGNLRVMANVLKRVAGVVEILLLAEARDDG